MALGQLVSMMEKGLGLERGLGYLYLLQWRWCLSNTCKCWNWKLNSFKSWKYKVILIASVFCYQYLFFICYLSIDWKAKGDVYKLPINFWLLYEAKFIPHQAMKLIYYYHHIFTEQMSFTGYVLIRLFFLPSIGHILTFFLLLFKNSSF